MNHTRPNPIPTLDKTALARLQSNLEQEERDEEEQYEEEENEEEDEGAGASIELPAPNASLEFQPTFERAPFASVEAPQGGPASVALHSVLATEPERAPRRRSRASDESPVNELSVEQILAQADEAEDYDIFLDVGEHLAAKNDDVSYSIKRSGRQVASIPHPYSYEQLQKDYGGGAFTISLRSARFSKKKGGGYIKTQTRTLEEPKIPGAAIQEKGTSAAEMLAMIQQMNDKARAEQQAEMARLREESRAREERLERESRLREERLEREAKEREARDREMDEKRKNEGNNTMMMFLKMMEQSSAQAQAAAQRQSDLLITLLTKAPPEKDKRDDKIFDMLLANLLDKKGKGESLDAMTLQKLLSDAEDKGYSRAKEIRELANEEAERLASRGGGGGGEDDDEDKEEKEETPTQTLLKTITPLIAQMAAQPAAPAAPPQRMIARQPTPMRPPMRRAPVNPNVPAQPPQAQTAPAAARPPQQQQNRPSAAQSMGLPRATPPKGNPMPQKTAPQAPQTAQAPQLKEIVSEVVVNLIGADLGANFLTPAKMNPDGVADKALASLADRGVNAEWLLKNFTLDDMKAVAKKKGIPDAVHPYLERFYARIHARYVTDSVTADRQAQQAQAVAAVPAPAEAPKAPESVPTATGG